MFGERGEHGRGVARPGAIIEGEHDLARPQEIVALEVLEAETGPAGGVDLHHPGDAERIGIAGAGIGDRRSSGRRGRKSSHGGRRRRWHNRRCRRHRRHRCRLHRRLRCRGCCDASGRGRWHFGDDCRGRWGRKCLGLGRRRDCGNRGRAMQRSFLRQDDTKDRQKYRDRKRAGCHGHSHHSLQIWDAIPKHLQRGGHKANNA